MAYNNKDSQLIAEAYGRVRSGERSIEYPLENPNPPYDEKIATITYHHSIAMPGRREPGKFGQQLEPDDPAEDSDIVVTVDGQEYSMDDIVRIYGQNTASNIMDAISNNSAEYYNR